MKTIDINEKQNVSYCISNDLKDEQIKINIRKVKGRVTAETELRKDAIALVSFGPSLVDTWEELKKFKYIMTCSGAHRFLIDRGIVPTWHVDLDPREHKIKILGDPHPDVEYLLASTIHPKYLDVLKDNKVKLWHIFANDSDAVRTLPRGEWYITGGSSVGLRLFTLSRFMGFTNFHVFGMDGNVREGGQTHTTKHPNAPKDLSETEFDGVKYLTTPSILCCAKETFHELDLLSDCKATFYGEGLVQAMFKKYKPSPKKSTLIAFSNPELISQEAVELNRKLHEENPGFGMGGSKHAEAVLKMYEPAEINSILDYGCGKGMLAKALPFPIWEYDPAIPDKSAIPKPADLVVCTDVLEHIEPDKLKYVLSDLARCTKQIGFFVISTRPAVKTYANGKNTHSIIQGKEWWSKKLIKYFDVATIVDKEKEAELHIIVSPKTEKADPLPEFMEVEKDGLKVKFYTPNKTTKWRAESLFTKEPSTIEWIKSMQPGEILYDIGANIGSYSILAGARGVKVFSFEPEAENYALLVKNMALNNIEPNAYCVAISDEETAGTLYAGQAEVGGACHSYNEQVGPDLQFREAKFTQGCLGTPLDSFIKRGLPHPQHLKIDVDGLEHKVIKGAAGILANGLKSILVEVNPGLPQHLEMLTSLEKLGFEYDPAQVERARRKEGAFEGCAEYIFRKKQGTPLEKYMAKKIERTELTREPFNYLYVENVFTDNVYSKILENLPDNYIEIEKSRGTKGYPKRFTAYMDANDYLKKITTQMLSGRLRDAICKKFGIRLPDQYSEDLMLIRDHPGYSIPPHTDATTKIISALFYLPVDNSMEDEGTGIYEPNQKEFTCKTGRHYQFEDFKKVFTAPFKPNSVLIFQRTDNSFHGVEPCSHIRNVLLYNLKIV